MALTKQQKTLAVGGGVLGLGVLVLGYFLYSATLAEEDSLSSAQRERDEAKERHNDYYKDGLVVLDPKAMPAALKGVFGSPATAAAVKTNEARYSQWYSNATEVVSAGDRHFESKNGSDFKDEMLKVVKQLAELPGGADGRIVNPGSNEANFGFEAYLGEKGTIPGDDDVPRLSVQLDTIRTVVGLLSEAGVKQVNAVRRVEPKTDEENGQKDKGKKDDKAKAGESRDMLSYQFEVTTRPTGFVAMLNGLTANPRFFVVRNLEFKEATDTILERIQAAETAAKQQQEAAAAPTSGRRRRRAAAVQEEPTKEQVKLNRVIYDPEVDAELRVKFDLDVYDFGTGEARAAAAAPEAAAEQKAEDAQSTNQKNEKESK